EHHGFERVELAVVPLLENRSRPEGEARLEPPVRPRCRTARAPRQMAERPAARDEHLDRHIGTDDAHATRARAVPGQRVSETAAYFPLDRVAAHWPSHRGSPSAMTGKTTS